MFENTLFLLQLAVIIGTSRAVAWLFKRIGQTQVVGEMAAGIVLGPTVFGYFAPQAFHSLFPPASLPFLNVLSQIGLVVFVFLVGVRTDFGELRPHSRLAGATSVGSILVPLVMGGLLAVYLFPRYGTVNQASFALFVGTAVSVTAFPVLARILMERDLLNTRIGTLAIACAAVADLSAWVLLTIITVFTQQSRTVFPPLWMAAIITCYTACVFGARHLLERVSRGWEPGRPSLGAVALLLVLAMLSAAATEWMGLHALIGAFIAGLVTPRSVRKELVDHLEPATLILLIPIFFALTGIKVNFLFSAGSGAYMDLLLIMAVAVASKWGAAAVTSHWMGLPWHEASQLGLMLNTRGLVELIVLNVGLEAGIISTSLYSLMVCMAIVTTVMATPVIDWIRLRHSGRPQAVAR
jgi:Kef-type K+ transport system membrane component KefB